MTNLPKLIEERRALILEGLNHALERDAAKGGSGFRTTREISDRSGISMSAVRKLLWKMVESGEVDAFDTGSNDPAGNAISWRVISKVRTTGG